MNPTAVRLLSACIVASLSALAAGCSAGEDDASSAASEAALSNGRKTAYNFFISKGLKPYQAAGIIGNLIQESSVDPTSVQYGGGPGRGIAQWSVGGRWDHDYQDNMVWFANQHGLSRWSLTAQLEFIWYELNHDSYYGLGALKASTSVSGATVAFEKDFEGCGICDQSQRISYAQQVLSAYGNGGGSGGGAGCYSHTLGKEMPDNACVQSKYDSLWWQCDNGDWVDRWSDPSPCDGIHPL
ncbi:MAG TPA: phage tail tip lysozyme [Polyangiaceae bacterium]|nr:phage tail tip lysozyme [Polyangiaceae bacterium]